MEKSFRSRDGLLLRSAAAEHNRSDSSKSTAAATTSSPHDFVLQWGNRKRLRCMKFQNNSARSHHHHKNEAPGPTTPVQLTDRVERRAVRSDPSTKDSKTVVPNGGNLNLRQRPASPSNRLLRNSENMKAHSNGFRGLASPDRHDNKRGGGGGAGAGAGGGHHNNNHSHHHHQQNHHELNNSTRSKNNHYHHGNNDTSNTNTTNNNNNNRGGRSPSSETTTHDGVKKGGSPTGSDPIPAVWNPKFEIALTNKEKEEDFLVLKGSKLPQRPKKRAKFVQRTVNLISPGAWLCDLSLERYEVREKKVTKKRPRGLKAMGNNMDSDSE